MQRAAITAALVFAACNGCAGWQSAVDKGLNQAFEAGVATRQAAAPLVDALCMEEAKECIAHGITNPEQCGKYQKCAKIRAGIAVALQGLQYAILDGKLALTVDDEKTAESALKRAIELAEEIRKQLKELGLI